jgi:hypothetical protein
VAPPPKGYPPHGGSRVRGEVQEYVCFKCVVSFVALFNNDLKIKKNKKKLVWFKKEMQN